MSEDTSRTIRIPVHGEKGEHTGHKIRTIVVSASEGIKGLYCTACKKIITYIFLKSKDWTQANGSEWLKTQEKNLKSLEEIRVDQEVEFLKIVAVMEDGETTDYLPANSEPFEMTEEIADKTMGVEKSEEEEEEAMSEKTKKLDGFRDIELIKVDRAKKLVYGVFLVPEEADHDGDVISEEDVEKVAHGFMAEYRTIDEMHKDIIQADIVESGIAWQGMDYHGKKLKKGTWFGAVKVYDKDVWEKVQSGEYKGFSVRISGVREPIKS